MREVQGKTMVGCHLTPAGWLSSVNQQTTSVGEDVGGGEPSDTVGGIVNWCGHHEEQYGGSSKS